MPDNVELSPEQRKFYVQCGYIRLSEWRLFSKNSPRVLVSTGGGVADEMGWFYVGSEPYNLHQQLGVPMEKRWPSRLQAQAALFSGQTVEENAVAAEKALELYRRRNEN
tara:strand:+ start:332 stop:658 length:327 start_codon:yes stop_codon:yes gene_type:complete